MYNEIVKGALDGILQTHPESIESKDERVINEIVSQALTNGGYPNIQCLSIFVSWGKKVEGVIHNGVSGVNEFKFRYDFESGKFQTIRDGDFQTID
jgi:hypothetical protein